MYKDLQRILIRKGWLNMSELTDLINAGNSILESPNDTIIAQRLAIINFFSKFHSIAAGEFPEGLRKKIYNACSSKTITEETNNKTGLEECTGARILQKMLMLTEALYNTDIYDRLNSVIFRLASWEYRRESNKFVPANINDWTKALDELWSIILKMTNLLYKKKIFGFFINVKLHL